MPAEPVLFFFIAILTGLILTAFIFLLKLCLGSKRAAFYETPEALCRLMREDASALREELNRSLMGFNESVRKTVEERLDKMQTETHTQLDQVRATVNEKLQTTLEKKFQESFALVSDRLEKVHQGLGEMQALASDVGGLKRVLTNVKTRGTWGEVQLGALLAQMLAPDQFVKNAHVNKNTSEVVEFAVKLPDGNVLIPIDSKFPLEDYERLMMAAEQANTEALEAAGAELEKHLRHEARKIAEKYICPPVTTDFAILFLPTEGLYAEIMRRPGIAAEIQNKYRISLAGPSTLGAFLNALQMGFKTVAIQKRSGEVWRVLNEVKNEFEKYTLWVDKLRRSLESACKVLDEAETRTRAVHRKLKEVGSAEDMTSLETTASPEDGFTHPSVPFTQTPMTSNEEAKIN